MGKPRYFFNNWDKLKKKLRGNYIMLFLDYDGTLAAIADSWDKAKLSLETKALLKELTQNHKCKLAIISGRALKDIKKITGLRNIIYAGNHGLEIEGPGIKFKIRVSSVVKDDLKCLKKYLSKKLLRIKGVSIEDKGMTLTAHYRLAAKNDVGLIKSIIKTAVQPYRDMGRIKFGFGKKVFEIKPLVGWDKGKAVLWLLSLKQFMRKKFLPVYIGDDLTDEDAFKAVKDKGLAIFVGKPRNTHAGYYFKNTAEVAGFLENLKFLN